jgi:hypothetical protein
VPEDSEAIQLSYANSWGTALSELVSYTRSTVAQIPIANRDAMLDILQRVYILPRPVYKAHVGNSQFGTLEISGGGELRAYLINNDALPKPEEPTDADVVDDPEGSDPSQDDFDYATYGQPYQLLGPLLDDIARLIKPTTLWNIYVMTPLDEEDKADFYKMRTYNYAIMNGNLRGSTGIAHVPAPRHPTVIVMEGGSLTGVLTDNIGPVVVYDHDEHKEDRGSAGFSSAGYYGSSPLAELDDELVEDVLAALKSYKHDGAL